MSGQRYEPERCRLSTHRVDVRIPIDCARGAVAVFGEYDGVRAVARILPLQGTGPGLCSGGTMRFGYAPKVKYLGKPWLMSRLSPVAASAGKTPVVASAVPE